MNRESAENPETIERRPTKEEAFARVAPTIAEAIKRNRKEDARADVSDLLELTRHGRRPKRPHR